MYTGRAQWLFLIHDIRLAIPKTVYFQYLENFLVQSIKKMFYSISRTEALAVQYLFYLAVPTPGSAHYVLVLQI